MGHNGYSLKRGALVSLKVAHPEGPVLMGTILSWHKDASKVNDNPFLDFPEGPGYTIMWYTTGVTALWSESAILKEILEGSFEVVG